MLSGRIWEDNPNPARIKAGKDHSRLPKRTGLTCSELLHDAPKRVCVDRGDSRNFVRTASTEPAALEPSACSASLTKLVW